MNLNDYLNINKESRKPFVLFSKPNSEQLIGVFQENTNHYKTSDFTESGFVFAPFHGEEAILIPLEFSEIILETHIESLLIETKTDEIITRNEKEQEAFEDLVTRGIEAIKNGDFEKVVLSRKERVSFRAVELFALFKRLKNNYPTAFCSLFYHPTIGVWMGATPEQLIKVEKGEIKTMALAGTQKNLGQKEVVWGEKEHDEQEYVTKFIVDSLKPFMISLEISEPYTKRAAKVMHICTDIRGGLKPGVGLKPILSALHPTPAVCGMPKQESREFILKNEGYDRAYYAGFLGTLNWNSVLGENEGTDLFVNLRCMEVEETHVNLFIGCGITRNSVPFDEFVETENKSTTMRKILN
ncbi:isochorismate synthase [Myroides guanonis]|uniref:isochorismate synthase n=1 Tax=Myroides guanonis TaxID=1150112 RepID=A0A1I3LE47_9FLAO|nr:isochorismate synthase [Myroides guanonis]SFI82971.1 isochorismate synthase [Myroides guanonis]